MSTNANIIVYDGEQYHCIYLHWDGYTDHVLPILTTHYNTMGEALELISLGNLSELADTLEECVAYGRDRGEVGQEAEVCPVLANLYPQEYNYLFDQLTGWEVIKRSSFQ